MKKQMSKKILRGILAAFLCGSFVSYATSVNANDYIGSESGATIGSENSGRIDISYENIFGKLHSIPGDSATNKCANEGLIDIVNARAESNVCIYGGAAVNSGDTNKKGDAEANKNIIKVNDLLITQSEAKGEIIGGLAISRPNGDCGNVYANNNKIFLSKSEIITNKIVGGYVFRGGASSKNGQANYNEVVVDNTKISGWIYGGYGEVQSIGYPSEDYPENDRDAVAETNFNKIGIKNTSTIGSSDNISNVCGSYLKYQTSGNTAIAKENTVEILQSNVYGNVYGTSVWSFQCSTGNDKSNDTDTVLLAENNTITVENGTVVGTLKGAYAFDENNSMNAKSKTCSNKVEISGKSSVEGSIYGADNYSRNGGGKAVTCEILGNNVIIDGNVRITNNEGAIYGGSGYAYAYDWGGGDAQAGDVLVKENKVIINGDVQIDSDIYGGYAKSQGGGTNDRKPRDNGHGNAGNSVASNNQIIIAGSSIEGNVYGGYAESVADGKGVEGYGKIGIVEADNNIIMLENSTNLAKANLYGSNLDNNLTKGNDLIVNGWHGNICSANNFNSINFQNMKWANEETVLKINSKDNNGLNNTQINLISMAGGQTINAGEWMYIVEGNGTDKLATNKNNIKVDNSFTAGVATQVEGEVVWEEDTGNIKYQVKDVSPSGQTTLVAENRAVAAAFINQGTDLLSDSLDTLSHDGKYGIKTFAAVHGNRSKYDVNSNIKINGWSSLVGVGNEKQLADGDFSWGIFYENGSGNYRTFNSFNNEFFRGDGSLVYNGAGVAARYEQNNGIYTEASLRTGMLKSEMDNALRDAAGNGYGYKSESSYYGAHLGIGKVVDLNSDRSLDFYGKFFHTYTEGDSFTVGGDKFEFDGITSDRLRIGARLNTNRNGKVNTYYGLAYEYEFNGEATMRAQGQNVPEQSLQGSSYMAEIGLNYQPVESPWSFDLNMRGYAGEREGFSGSVQAVYAF